MMLVPEIALTPQMVLRFKRRFGDDVAVLHPVCQMVNDMMNGKIRDGRARKRRCEIKYLCTI